MASQVSIPAGKTITNPQPKARRDRNTRRDLLTLEQSLALDEETALDLHAAHLDRYAFLYAELLGLRKMDIASAQGCEIVLRDGRRILDYSGGFGVLGLGHNHPRIIAAERRCHDDLVLDCIKIAPHKLQGALAYNIARFLPEPLDVSFLAVSGAEANEAAMKLCERVQTPKGKTKFLCIGDGADGLGPFLMGVPEENVIFCHYGDIASVREAIAREGGAENGIIAVMVETLRGTSCESPPPGYFTELVEACRAADILTIFDEVKVGMGRTGLFCAFQHEDAVPDVVTLAKTLGGGKREMGAMVTSQALFDKAYGNTQDCNLHSSSFSGMGESCAVAIETLNVLAEERLIERAGAMGAYLRAGLERLQAKHPRCIASLRGKGCFQAVAFDFSPIRTLGRKPPIATLTANLLERHGVLAHYLPEAPEVLHFMPPYVVTEAQIDRLIAALDDVLGRIGGHAPVTGRMLH
ncbi:putrescine aminotransferase [Novosphingobium sp. PhB165]|uniref:aspartate aminotransferase family protein n=1 Tax=Novosphingobium sp. PhB165 TaxID=2485105 RepID=UPI00104A1E51|nr:aspartate aminotransferase family protein [Novosphingobium sp. PhB165]TCM21401.1 putrescine aminotransferase [Novosphingobium sp. PhB165]